MSGCISMVTPLLLHMVVSTVTAAVFGSSMDAASCTMLSAVLVMPAAVWMYRKDMRQRERVSMRETRGVSWYAGYGVLCLVAGGVLNLAWSGVLNMIHIQEHFSNETQEALLAGRAAVQVAGLGLAVPLAEELIFRGLIYERMKGLFPVKVSIFLSALLFAVYHGNPIQMIFAFPMAIALAAVMEHGKSLAFPVLFHVGANMTAVVLSLLQK